MSFDTRGHRIPDVIGRFVRESPLNRHAVGRYFDAPLVGIAAAGDPLFRQYKSIIGPFHFTPAELFEKTFGDSLPVDGSVICWILPISSAARRSNRKQRKWPSADWARTRTHGETLNDGLREHLVAFLAGLGRRAVAPVLSPAWRQVSAPPAGIASAWSERHAAYAAGLGTFSLSDGLITEKGIAHRCGSVITELALAPTPRPYTDRAANCLFYREGGCALCVARCPARAISPGGHDKARCNAYLHEDIPSAVGKRYDVPVIGCGLCQTGVPCEAGIPPGTRKAR